MADKTEEEQKLLDLLKYKRALEKAELKDTEQYIDTVKQIEILQQNIKEHQKGILKYFGDTNKAATALKASMREMGNSIKQISQIWVATDFTNIGTTLLKQNVEIEKSLHRTLVNSGKFGSSLKEATKDVISLRTQFGATYQEAAAVVKTLSEKQYTGNLKEAADTSFLFARATGMGKDEVAELTVALQKEGKISGKATTAMYADLLKIQQSNGMTKEGMKATTDQIVKMSAQMRAFGKSEGEIRQMAAATGRLVSSFEKVGISAQEATQWINKMLDPEKIEENIASYAALGISMTDALAGNIDQGQLESGLKEFGEKVKAMGPIAGKAYAQAMGISYSMAIKATDAEKATEEALTPEESAAKSLEALTDATQSMHEKIEEVFNKLEGHLQGLPNIILLTLGILGPQIGKVIGTAFNKAFENVGKNASTVSERITQQLEKGSLKAKDVMQVSFDELWSNLDGTSTEVEDSMRNKIGKVFGELSRSAKGMNWFKEQEKGIDSVINKLKAEKLELVKEHTTLETNKNSLEKQINAYKALGNLTDEQRIGLANCESELRNIQKRLSENDKMEKGLQNGIERQEKIRKSLNEMLKAGNIELEAEKNSQNELNNILREGNDTLNNRTILKPGPIPTLKETSKEKSSLIEKEKNIKNSLKEVTKELDKEKSNIKDSLTLMEKKKNEQRRELIEIKKKLNFMSHANSLSKEELKLKDSLVSKEEKARKALEKTTKELEKEKKIQEQMASGKSRFQASMAVSKRDFGMKASMFGGKVKGTLGNVKEKLLNNRVTKRISNSKFAGKIGGMAGKVGGALGGIGGAVGKVMKVLGPIGIVVGVIGMLLKKSQKFQEFVKKIQEKVIEPIMKHIGEIFDQIDFNAITDVLCTLLPPVLKVISWALKPIVFVLNLIATGIKKLLKVFGKSIDTEQQIAENTADTSNAMEIRASTDGSVRTFNASNGETKSDNNFTNSSKTTASKPKNSSDTKVDNSEGGGFFKSLADTFVKATPFGALSTGIEQMGEIAKELIEMKKEQNSNSPAKQQALADSIRMGVDGVTLEIKDGSSSRMAVITGLPMFKDSV